MRILRAFVLLSVLLLARADADANADEQAAPESELPDFSKMRVKQLQALLDERGVTCAACTEKEHLLERVKETYHLPLAPVKPKVEMPSGIPKPDFQYTADPANEKSKKEDVSEMLAKLRKQMPGSKFNLFDRESMAKMAGKFQPGQRYTDPQAFERFKEQAADNMGQAEAGEARRKKARAAPAQAEDEGGEDVSTGSSDGGEETAAEL